MFKVYFKQAFQLLRQNKLISIISIVGTALAIMMIMVIILTEQVKIVNIVPEPNRDKSLYLTLMSKHDKETLWTYGSPVEYNIYKDYISQMETPELITAMYYDRFVIKSDKSKEYISAVTRLVDANYWKVVSLDFIEGTFFNEAEFDAGMQYVVISENVVNKLFDGKNAIGETLEIEATPHKIIGVVKNVIPTFTTAYADIWIPYISNDFYEEEDYDILFLTKHKKDFPLIIEELDNIVRKYNLENDEWEIDFEGPHNHRDNVYAAGEWDINKTVNKANRRTIIMFIILLLVPAINLSNFNISQIRKRYEEIGIRRAFGATKNKILLQVLTENFLCSLIGGVIGLILSYFMVILLKDWLMGLEYWQLEGMTGMETIPIQSLISIPVFIAVFVICIIFNLLSAFVPAYKASKIVIVESINQNED
ncbi:MAG: ABC transporter permease [Bacteroidales bacterium]|jgi:putative ABC transport system permease protein|nr:ABC transporter permease [Bacteroidales bacterium]